jgi:hypothetical protein
MASTLRFTKPASDIIPKNVNLGPKFKKAARNEKAIAAIGKIKRQS